jgi:hypothetical protein
MGNSGGNQSNAQDLIALMMAKTASDLSLDVSVPKMPTAK